MLSGARCYFEAMGYERISMSQLAKQLGIVKGTLYLDFPTKAAIVLALCSRAIEDWSQVVKTKLADGLTEDDFVRFFYDSAVADPIFAPILVRMAHVAEHNIPIALSMKPSWAAPQRR
ncbi:TetR/AcrR family transcriptional regulator [Paraglaciecola sp.]|nr:TetR/AcrR family transcriptional regulator [Paraglaciecola sp.]MDA9368108.1 TetR/AcrR family transcriptional regulator [Flavobacteriaceae bacterium]MDB4281498.1 TetR/AcrR family transcriptional regulator [Paraglaciecola sp.]